MKNKKTVFYLAAVAVFLLFVWKGIPAIVHRFLPQDKTIVTHEALVEKIQQMGHMQVIKLNIKDIVEYKVERTLLPDSKVLLMVTGEVGASIDLRQLKDSDITSNGDQTLIYVPLPEVTYSKIDHQHTKIHDKTSWIFLDDDAELIDNCYKQADAYMQSDVVTQQAVKAAIEAAPGVLTPLFSTLTGTEVVVKFRKNSIIG